MGFEQHITCDGPACEERALYDQRAFDHGRPEGWLTLREVPSSANEDDDHRTTHDFCSLGCLAAWAAQQVGKSLVQYKAWTPPSSQVDLRQPFGCWPLGTQNAGSARADAIGGSQASGTAIFGVISSSDEYNAGIAR